MASRLAYSAATLGLPLDAFLRKLAIDPHTARVEQLCAIARDIPALADFAAAERDAWLDALFVECIQPELGRDCPTILYDYPASQSALAQTRTCADGETKVAQRFELFINGIELANGYGGYLPPREQHELGGYETWPARSSFLEPDAESKIRGEALRLLRMQSRPR